MRGNKGPEELINFLGVKQLKGVRSECLVFNSHEVRSRRFFNIPISTFLTMNSDIFVWIFELKGQ